MIFDEKITLKKSIEFDKYSNTINEGIDYESERKNAKFKSININNANINLNSINNITNKFEFGEINNSKSNFKIIIIKSTTYVF